MDEPTDGDLLAQWRRGDATAGRKLYDRHAPIIVRFFRNKAGSDFEDLVQQTFEACLRGRDGTQLRTSFRLFLLGIARHKLYDHLFRGRGANVQIDGMTTSVADVDPTPSAVVARHERDRQLAWCLRAIPIDLQIVVELHYWEGLSTAELAEVLEIAQGTVKTRLMRARKLVRERLDAAPGIGDPPEDELGLATWVRSLREAIDVDSP